MLQLYCLLDFVKLLALCGEPGSSGSGCAVLTTYHCRSVFDSDGPIITDYFYRNLFNPDTINSNDRPEQRMEAARALHNAVAELRDTPGRSFEHWVPFIHLGL